MKVIKLNGRWKQYREHRHAVAFKFYGWGDESSRIEKLLRQLTNESGYHPTHGWYSYFGQYNSKDDARPYYITVKDEQVATMALLMLGSNT